MTLRRIEDNTSSRPFSILILRRGSEMMKHIFHGKLPSPITQVYLLLVTDLCFFEAFVFAEKNISENSCNFAKDNSACKVEKGDAICRLHDVKNIAIILEERNITSLDLSHNCIQIVPERSLHHLSQLSSLSLAFNKIEVLPYYAFEGLDALRLINLTMNPLISFIGNASGLLPSLTFIDLTGVKHLNLDKQLLQLPRLKKVVGFSFSNHCTDCSLFLPHHYKKMETFESQDVNTTSCMIKNYSLSVAIPQVAQLLNGTLFQLKCKRPWECAQSENNGIFYKVEDLCWDKTLIVFKVQGIVGIVGLIFNMVVVLNVISSKLLRQNVSMLFVWNMALSDTLLCLYAIVIEIHVNSHSFHYLHHNASENNWKIGWLWTLGQASSVITSFIMTLERYLVIVFTMKPDLRISRRMARVMIVACWVASFSIAGYALHFNLYSHFFLCMPVRLKVINPDHLHTFIFGSVLLSIGLILYLASFFLYIHIYIVAKRTAQSAGVRRESQMVKRIAVLVGSNVFFFYFPVFATGAISIFYPRSLNTTAYVLVSMSISFNSCLNPFIHAFRNDRFKQVFKCHFNGLLQHITLKGTNLFTGRLRNGSTTQREQTQGTKPAFYVIDTRL